MKQDVQDSYDVVIIGKGIAGLSAATEATKQGASVAIVYDNQESSSSLAYEGVFRLSENSEEFEDKVFKYSCGLAKRDLLSSFFKAYKESLYSELKEIFPLGNAQPVGKRHRFGGPGILGDLEERCRANNVEFINGKAVKIGTADNRACAVQVFCYPRLYTYATKSVIVASGGGIGNIYESSDNIRTNCTPGPILALNAGAKLRDMEFISFHPFGVDNYMTFQNTTPIFTFFDIGVRTKIYSKKTGERVPFIEDLISSTKEYKNAHDEVFQIAQEVWRNGGVYFYKGRSDNQKRYDARVVAHSLNGGIDTDANYETAVRGLYSVGEATGGLNGASRMPGMALLEGFIAGMQAGKSVTSYANNTNLPDIDFDDLIRTASRFGKYSNLTNQTRKIADAAIFMERSEPDLLKYQDKILALMSDITKKEIAQYIEYDISEMVLAIIKASLLRKESRGFFYRTDYPNIDQTMEKSILVEKNTSDNQLNVFWENNQQQKLTA